MKPDISDGPAAEQLSLFLEDRFKLVDMQNNIQAEVATRQERASYYAQLEKASRVDKDSIEEFMGSVVENRAERIEAVESEYLPRMGTAAEAWAEQFEEENGRAPTLEEWHGTSQYQTFAVPLEETTASYGKIALKIRRRRPGDRHDLRAAVSVHLYSVAWKTRKAGKPVISRLSGW